MRPVAGLSTAEFREPSTHLVGLGRAVDRTLKAEGLSTGAIDRLAVVTGPGSFTGLRIGLSFAKGLHAATGVQVVTIATPVAKLPSALRKARWSYSADVSIVVMMLMGKAGRQRLARAG